MDTREWTAGRLLEVSGGYWEGFTLHAAVVLDLFTLIGHREMTADEVAEQLGEDLRGVVMLLDGLVAMGLLRKERERYANTGAARSLLVKDSPRFVGHMVMHHHHLVNAWARLAEAVKSGSPVREKGPREEEERAAFLKGMFNIASGIAPLLASQLDLSTRRHLLDLGGGPGTYAIHFCRENPQLKATVFDLPTTEPFARKTIERFGLSERISFVAGDYLKDDIGGQYDVAWLSHILHSVGHEACRLIIEKTVNALLPGGLLLIHDFFLNETRDGPLFPALFSLNMLVNTDDGRAYSEKEVEEMLLEAGLNDVKRLPFRGPNDSGIMMGVR
ncbi:MAG: SAM-dependent methyltransferase [Thermoplasmata archaeon]|nr:MAG: SAM-dependent methyltransferase [Thermoplasmata archaeon]